MVTGRPHSDQGCLVMHISCLLFKLRPHVGTPKMNLGEESLDLFALFPKMVTLNKFPLFAFHCYFVCLFLFLMTY